jgi:hypothetical protein
MRYTDIYFERQENIIIVLSGFIPSNYDCDWNIKTRRNIPIKKNSDSKGQTMNLTFSSTLGLH